MSIKIDVTKLNTLEVDAEDFAKTLVEQNVGGSGLMGGIIRDGAVELTDLFFNALTAYVNAKIQGATASTTGVTK